MKPINYFLLAILLCSVIIASAPAPAYTIENNTVFINDSNVYLSATPHTLSSSGWVYFNLTTKTYTNDIDMAWGFNTSVSKPTKAELYSPHWVNTTSQHEQTFYNVTAFTVYTGTDFDYGNIYNTNYSYTATHEIVTYNESTMEPNGTDVIDSNVSFDSFVTDGTNYTITWHNRHDSYVDWLDFSSSFTALDYDYEGYNKWYYVTNIPVVATTEYTMRAWVDVPVGLSVTSGKYYVAVKPSSETIPESIAAGRFYALDPWWNSSWTYYKTHTLNQTMINDSIGTGHYTLLVEYTDTDLITKAQSDGDDIVFTSSANVSLPHQLSIFNSTTGYVKAFVGLSDVTNVSSVNMYYNNSGATNTENKSGVWGVNASGIWSMDEGLGGYANDSSGNGNNGTINGADWVPDGLDFVAANSDYIDCGDDDSLDLQTMTLSSWVFISSGVDQVDWTTVIQKGSGDGTNELQYGLQFTNSGTNAIQMTIRDSSDNGFTSNLSGNIGHSLSTNTWHHIVGTYNQSDLTLYVDGIERESNSIGAKTLADTAESVNIGRQKPISNRFFNGSIGFASIYNRALSTDEIATTYNNTNQPLLFISTGTEQTETAGDTTPPTYTNTGTNNTIAGQSTLFYIQYDDNTALHTNGQYIFATNNTGTWVNETAVNFTATPQYANVTKALNASVGVTVGYRWYGTDNATNEGNTPIYTVTTTSTPTDTSFTVSLPAGVTAINFTATTATDKLLTPGGQTSSIPILNVTNTGDVQQSFRMYLNTTVSNVLTYACLSNALTSPTEINTTTTTVIISNLAADTSDEVWMYCNLTQPSPGTFGKQFTVNSS